MRRGATQKRKPCTYEPFNTTTRDGVVHTGCVTNDTMTVLRVLFRCKIRLVSLETSYNARVCMCNNYNTRELCTNYEYAYEI